MSESFMFFSQCRAYTLFMCLHKISKEKCLSTLHTTSVALDLISALYLEGHITQNSSKLFKIRIRKTLNLANENGSESNWLSHPAIWKHLIEKLTNSNSILEKITMSLKDHVSWTF